MRQTSDSAALDASSIFADFQLAARPAVIAAVSGGSDSLSLLFLLDAFLETHAPATRLVAVTVDHGLRAESAEEAAIVARLCAARGIVHRTVRWTGEKPASGLPAAAREARYELLASAAQAEGTDCVLTGHTLDDQLETVAMREARGDGRGLAGMAPATLFDGRVWILRPLLGLSRAALRGWLAEHGITWVDDPTNVDEKYERARVRAAAGDGGGPREAAATIASAASARLHLGEQAAGAIRAHARWAAPGLVAIDRSLWDHPNPKALYAMRIVLAVLGGTPHLPDAGASAMLLTRMPTERFRATLSRVVIDAAADAVLLHRERRGLPAAAAPAPGAIWDGRFRLGELPHGTSVAPVGRDVAREMVSGAQPPSQAILPRATPRVATEALAAEPALWRDQEFAGLATEAGLARRIIAPWARFLPSFDLAPAEAIAALIRADLPPKPPLARHNPGRG